MAGYLESDNLPNSSNSEIFRSISQYKIPIIFTGAGIILFIIVIILQIKGSNQTGDIVFETATSSGKIKIAFDIEGAVEKPGLYQLDDGARIEDVLILSGGLSANADRGWVEKTLNRAAKLIDGGKLYIPSTGEISSSNLLGITSSRVNINSASKPQLESLPGVGPAAAVKIISGRPYMTLEELKSKKIVGNALYEKIKDLITE